MEEQLFDAGPSDTEMNQYLRRWTSLLIEQPEQHMLGTDKRVAEICCRRIGKS
jgi:hypothetical protein